MKTTSNIETTKRIILNKTENCGDIYCREIKVVAKTCYIIFAKALCENELILKGVMQDLINVKKLKDNAIDYLMNEVLTNAEVDKSDDINELVENLLYGKALVLLEGESEVIHIDVEKVTARAIAEPPTGVISKGPREGFNESLKMNMALIRKRLPSPKVVVKDFKIGRRTRTRVSLIYIDDICDGEVVKKIEEKLNSIDVDGIIDSYYLVRYLSKRKKSIFKQVGSTEKPDVAVAKILEGRVAIIVDGSPVVLTLPYILWEDFQNAEDYYSNYFRATFIRYLRFFGAIFSIFLPGLYVALQLYHYSIIPIKFLVTIANTTQGLPFTPLFEVIFIIFLFEVLNEASLRMPRSLGMALSIVGALILGDTAVKAGLISPPAVMIVALSGITIFTVPEQANQLYNLRMFFLLAGGLLGLYGIILGGVFIIAYLCDFDSYGAAYLAPYSPKINSDLKDFLLVKQMPYFKSRPKSFKQKNNIRENSDGNNY